MNERKCPACGASDIRDEIIDTVIKEPFGGEKTVETHEIVCSLCGSRGDFFNENETVVVETIKKLKQKSIVNILKDFSDHKISMSAIERALEIPQRTLTKWKNGNAMPSSTGIALMRFIRLFPWLLEVAERKYDYNEAQRVHINAALQRLLPFFYFDRENFADSGMVTYAYAHINFEQMAVITGVSQTQDPFIDFEWVETATMHKISISGKPVMKKKKEIIQYRKE
jgi:DNA-binding transcriptional regulator YiaG